METEKRNIKRFHDYDELGKDDCTEEGSIRKIDFSNHIMVRNVDLDNTFQEYAEKLQSRNIYFD